MQYARRLAAAAFALAVAIGGQPTAARPFTVDDLLHQESFGAAAIDPKGHWLVFEQRAPYDTADRYDYNRSNGLGLSTLRVVDLRSRSSPRPLLPDAVRQGVVLGAFSPTGQRLAVYRLHDRRWSLGVVTMATGEVRWFGPTPQAAAAGRTLQWISDREFLLIARTDDQAPADIRAGWSMAARLPALWASAASGQGAHTVLGSGAYAAVRPRWPQNQLLRVDAETERSAVLAQDAFTDLELSPDGRRLALFHAGADIQARSDGPVRGPAGLETEAVHLTILTLKDRRRTEPLPGADWLPQLLSWSPSGRYLLGLTRGTDGLWTTGRLRRINVGTGRAQVVGENLSWHADLNPVRLATAWIGDDPVILSRSANPQSRQDWRRLAPTASINLTSRLPPPDKGFPIADATGLTVLANGEAWSVDAHGDHPQRLAHGPLTRLSLQPPETARLDRAPRPVAWVASSARALRFGPLTRIGLRPFLPALPEGAALLAASRTARTAVTLATDEFGVQRLWLLRAGKPAELVDELNGGLADAAVPTVWPIRHVSPAGQALTSWLYLPAGSAAGRLPLVVRPYLGASYLRAPQDPAGEAGLLQNLRLLTAHGYAVLVPSLPNPPGGMTDPAAHLAERILEIVDLATRDPQVGGRIDANRLGIMGFSFGGYSAMTAITQTSRFRAAVSISGISDLTAYWASLSPQALISPEDGYVGNWHTGGVEVTQPRMLGPPWREGERYRRNSPLLAADRIATPLLLFHGALDPVPHAGSEAMYSALFRQGKDALLVTYWGELHGVTSPGDVRDLYARTFAFFDAHFTPGPQR